MCVVTKESNPELYNALFPEDGIKEILELTYKFIEEELDKGTPKKDIIKAYSTQLGEVFNYVKGYITNLQKEKERLLNCLNDLHSLYHYKFDKILEQIKIIEDADLNEYNFCKFIDKVKNILQGSDSK